MFGIIGGLIDFLICFVVYGGSILGMMIGAPMLVGLPFVLLATKIKFFNKCFSFLSNISKNIGFGFLITLFIPGLLIILVIPPLRHLYFQLFVAFKNLFVSFFG